MQDMTRGNPIKIIILFSLPILLGNVFQQFYTMADTIMVGRILGVDALAAMGSTSALAGLVLMLSIGFVMGFSIRIAQEYGAGDEAGIRRSIANTLVLSILVGVVITIIALVSTTSILTLLETPIELMGMANGYLRIMFAGIMISIAYNFCASVLRAVGDSKTPLYFLILASILNIGLDYIFIAPFGLGINGAAYATLIAQGISVILCVIYMVRKYAFLKLSKADFQGSFKVLMDQFAMGVSMALMNCVVSIGSVVLQSAVNQLGASYIAAQTAARKISEVFMQPLGSIGIATTTFASQNFGAHKMDRIHEGVRKSVMVTFIFSLIVIFVSYTCISFFIGFFIDASETVVIEQASYYMRINALCYFALGALMIYRNVLQGLGKKVVPIISSCVEMGVKVAATFLLTPLLGYTGIVIAEPIAWVLMAILLWGAYRYYQRRLFIDTSVPDGIDEDRELAVEA